MENHDWDHESVIAALLELKYENKLNKTKYREIREAIPRKWWSSSWWKSWWNRWWYRWRSWWSRSWNRNRSYNREGSSNRRDRWRSSRSKDRSHSGERRISNRSRHN